MINQNTLLQQLGLTPSPDKQQNRLLVELTVQLSQNQSDIIYYYDNDQIADVATKFCQQHGLDQKVETIIINKINESMAQNTNNKKEEKENYFSFVNQKQPTDQFYERLYKDAELKKQRQEKLTSKLRDQQNLLNKSAPHIKRDKTPTQASDIYMKQTKLKKYQEQLHEKQRVLKDELEKQQLTFRPQLSQNSIRMVNQSRQNRTQQPEYYLIKQGQIMKEQKRVAEQQQQNSTAATCSFRPSINKISQKIYEDVIQKQQPNEPKYQQLYNQARQRQITPEPQRSEEVYTHHPMINPQQQHKQYMPFLDRMDISIKVKEDKLKQEMDQSLMYDQRNGQMLFKPQIQKSNRSRGGMSIGEYLYNQKKSGDDSVVQFDVEDLGKSLYTERSFQIVKDMRRKKLEEYFILLDSDKDGLISINQIDIDALPYEVMQLLSPILMEMEQLDIYMNIDVWTDKCQQLVDRMNIHDKNKLFLKPKLSTEQSSSQFRPSINPISEELAKQRRTYKGPVGLYQNGLKECKQKERRMEQLKKEQEEKENRHCTFKPKIIK